MRTPHRLARQLLLGSLASLALPFVAHAAVEYNKWVTVTLPTTDRASCGNGSPARILVNRAPNTTKTLVYFEGGGACWTQKGCAGKGALIESATNPNGIAENYFSQINAGVFGMGTPLIVRSGSTGKIFTQTWNMVYVPYCTGDVHAGDSVQIYKDNDPAAPLTYFHRGYVNAKAIAKWMQANMPQPEQLLVSGSSAGGVGATANYGALRLALNPKQSALAADSGPLFPAPVSGSVAQYPSIPLQNKVRQQWGVDGPTGVATELIAQFPNAGTTTDLSTINTGLAKVFPQDRFGFMTFQEDGIYSAFSYNSFYPEITALTGTAKDAALNKLWRKDVANWVNQLKTERNVGYYIPTFRPVLKAHTLLLIDFSNTGIEDQKIASVRSFLENIVDPTKAPMRAVEVDQVGDHNRIFSNSFTAWIVSIFQGLLI